MRRIQPRVFACVLAGLIAGLLLPAVGRALESPTSYGEVATVDTPILRVPFTDKAPTLDGIHGKGEWEDASALSGFWYDYASAKFLFMAPHQTQVVVYAAYDKEHLYIMYSSPVYPANTWFKARGRFPDVIGHPRYGLIWDDHIELELRPYPDNARGFQLGLFKWFINPINTISDQYWSIHHGEGRSWNSAAQVGSKVGPKRWVLEIAVPLEQMVHKNYTGKDEDGNPFVKLPPPPGTAYRCWFTRGIGGNQTFFNAFDNHVWNTTKTKLILDPQAPSFQINDLGTIMDDMIDVELTIKNHNVRSKTVRIGFFVENENGLVYSSYDAPELKEGRLELVPGAVQTVRLRKPFPGISRDGNALWFDVRSAGQPAKVLFRTRLIRFHSMEGGEVTRGETVIPFKQRRLDVIAQLRPPKKDFDFLTNLSAYHKRLSAVVDVGLYGGSEEAKRAEEAKLIVMKNDPEEEILAEAKAAFHGDFATFVMDLPDLVDRESYKLSLLLFDKNRRIVGERNPDPFVFRVEEWIGNKLGTEDVVWEPFVPIEKRENGLETLKHRITLAANGLPAQIFIKPDARDLPLEERATPDKVGPDALVALGRGPQLAGPVRIVGTIGGKRMAAKVQEPARLVREGKSTFAYASRVAVGPVQARLETEVDCDGALRCRLTYGAEAPVQVDSLAVEMDVAGLVDLSLTSAHGGGMAGADVWECSLPDKQGVVFDSRTVGVPELFYSCFQPWHWFGSADRAFTFFADSDRAWMLDRDGTHLQLERQGEVTTWRMFVVNHPVEVSGERTITFTLLTHPSKPKPKDFRELAWLWRGGSWADEYPGGQLYKNEEELLGKARMMAGRLSGLPKDAPKEKVLAWSKPEPPFWRFYQLRNAFSPPRGQGTAELDQRFEDKFVYHFDRHLRVGRRHGWWWDETWPVYRSDNVAEGNAYFRDPGEVGEKELPWQAGFLTGHMRSMFKRLARRFVAHNVPLRNYLWANNSATCFESFAWDTMLVEECGSEHRTFEVDVMTQYPNSHYRYLCHNFTGLVARLAPGVMVARHGDSKRLDRQLLGRVLLNDIGLSFNGPHGNFVHREQALRVIQILRRFGYFEADGRLEAVPFWRNNAVQFGDGKAEKVFCTAYRRPLDGGGFKALLVVVNEGRKAVSAPVKLADAEHLLGGPNTLTAAQVRGHANVSGSLQAWWKRLAGRNGMRPVLQDAETGGVVAGRDRDEESYGPLYIPYHDYRLLYAESRPD